MAAFKPIATTRSATGVLTSKLAVWWLLASEVVIFGGVLCSYLMHRIAHPEWAAYAAHTNEWIGLTNTFVLLSSSLTAVLAHNAAEREDGPLAARWLLATVGGACLFLMIKSFEWYTEISHGYTISANGFWSFYYTAAGIHASHVIAGGLIMLWVANTARKNEELHRVENVGLYWHFVDIVWIFLFPLLYIAK
ncbi:MAG TPA: cytochrome oxidase subunit III [Deltaproteobacteria bacterium]|nr:cytochrome oxidase subunit III [Deltaproteobacteria bacterium]